MRTSQKVSLLDCTLRDGGYINDWRFGEKAIEDIAEKLSKTGVEVLEVGFLKNESYDRDRTVFNDMAQVKKLIGPKRPGVLYAVMCEVVNPLPLDMLAPADKDSADIIRVIVWKTKHDKDGNVVDALDEGFEYCKGIKEKGYRLCVQPARVDQYSDADFVKMVRRFATLDPMAIYVVDSWGTQNAEELLHYMHMSDANMPRKCALGYHGHNNMMQALSVAQAMLKEGFNRDLIVDASVYGIGRGAGNLNLEIMAKYLNEHWSKGYQIDSMLQVYDSYIQPIFKIEPWGYSIPYYLTAKNNCNPNYGWFYRRCGVGNELISALLRALSPEDKVIFSERRANAMYRAYHRNLIKLAVLLVTADEPMKIDRWLYQVAHHFQSYGIDVIVFDKSGGRNTEAVVKNFILDGCDNLVYRRLNRSTEPDVQEEGLFAGFLREYDYIWKCSGCFAPSCDYEYDTLLQILRQRLEDVVILSSSGVESTVQLSPGNRTSFFNANCMRSVLPGAMIFSTRILREIPESAALLSCSDPSASMRLFYQVARKAQHGMVFGACQAIFKVDLLYLSLDFDLWFRRIPDLLRTLSLNDGDVVNGLSGLLPGAELACFRPFFGSSLALMRCKRQFNVLRILSVWRKFAFMGIRRRFAMLVISFIPVALLRRTMRKKSTESLNNMKAIGIY